MNIPLITVAMILLITWSGGAKAVGSWEPSDAEMRGLPPYCNGKLKGNKTEAQLWAPRLGEGYGHIHHYCVALNFIRRAEKNWKDKENQKFNYNRARTNIQYMLTHTSESYFMRPEFHVKLGEVLIQLGRESQGAAEFEKAIAQKADYIPAYTGLSDYYKKLGQLDMAREALQRGLERAPESRSLKRRLKRLKK